MPKLADYKDALANVAFSDAKSLGRKNSYHDGNRYDDDEMLFGIFSAFRIDRQKIINSKAFRRLANKTQVFPSPQNPHIRTRLQHTLEVEAIATTISSFLGLNVELTQAIALGHDLGHAPFGHFGERLISELSQRSFNHAINGLVVAQEIERKGGGLNLCCETLQGMLYHSSTKDPLLVIDPDLVQEFNVVKLADKVAYTFSDYNDAKRAGYIQEPNSSNISYFGQRQRQWVNTCLIAILEESAAKGFIAFCHTDTAKEFQQLRQWLNQEVYRQIDFSVQKSYCLRLLDFLSQDSFFQGCDPFLLFSLLTDCEVFQFGELCNTVTIPKIAYLQNFGLLEIVPWIKNRKIDFGHADLRWANKKNTPK